jgi:hypothetical protein
MFRAGSYRSALNTTEVGRAVMARKFAVTSAIRNSVCTVGSCITIGVEHQRPTT